jgi:hypothetical protein
MEDRSLYAVAVEICGLTEAQALVAVVEAQRKTIDTHEIVERVERLEAAAKR